MGCTASGRLPAQGPAAAPQPPNRRNWPRHGLECPLQLHTASPLAASSAEAKMPSVCLGQFVSGGTRSPRLVSLSVRKFHQAVISAVTAAGKPSAPVPPNACLRACGDWMRDPLRSAHSILAVAAGTSACPHQPARWPCAKARGSADCASVRLRPGACGLQRSICCVSTHSRQVRHFGSSLRLLSGTLKKLRRMLRGLCFLWGVLEASCCCRLTQQSGWRLLVA